MSANKLSLHSAPKPSPNQPRWDVSANHADQLVQATKAACCSHAAEIFSEAAAMRHNNNNNNNRICIAQVCRMTSEALDGQLQSCYAARA